jgi:hypothetical protein
MKTNHLQMVAIVVWSAVPNRAVFGLRSTRLSNPTNLHTVSRLDGLLLWKARHGNAHLKMLLHLGTDLGGQLLIEEIGVGNFLFRHLFQACGKLLFDLIEPQVMPVFVQRSSCGVLMAPHCLR